MVIDDLNFSREKDSKASYRIKINFVLLNH